MNMLQSMGSTRWNAITLALAGRQSLIFGVISVAALLIILFALHVLAKRRSQSTINQFDILDEEKNCLDSSFSAYLGHNILTDSSPYDASYTSRHAIRRLEGQTLQEYLETVLSDEPPCCDTHIYWDDTKPVSWQSLSYPDSPTQQICFDTVQTMYDSEDMRTWQRKTRQIYGV